MALFKCKMCGGDLDVNEGANVIECDYCGTKQTVPSMDSEKKVNLFNRANKLRLANDFDKAAGVYESIVAEYREEAEAYWGLCLCKYGIEYVDDPATGKKIPTCHRTQFTSIFEDSDFELALENADSVAVGVYREEAKEIDRLQKAILDIAKNEEPFDIFICYKETAEDGQRTKDSVLAQDMYEKLTEKGYKVFFARITLEDKLGQEYEPYIFSALNSAKIMLAVGTKYEYYNAVWVKNEWSRFLDMMKVNKEKVLIPCYSDIDAYDMPQEFKNLQGQDMGKVGFMQDLIRGIGKIIPLESAQPQIVQTVVQQVPSSNSNAENLVKRGFLSLEDGRWDEAADFFEKALNQNAEEAKAYVGEFMVSARLRTTEDIAGYRQEIAGNEFIKKALRFADSSYKKVIEGYIERCRYNVKLIEFETARRNNDFVALERLSAVFRGFNGFMSSADFAQKCTAEAEGIKSRLLDLSEGNLRNGNWNEAKRFVDAYSSLNKPSFRSNMIYLRINRHTNDDNDLISYIQLQSDKNFADAKNLVSTQEERSYMDDLIQKNNEYIADYNRRVAENEKRVEKVMAVARAASEEYKTYAEKWRKVEEQKAEFDAHPFKTSFRRSVKISLGLALLFSLMALGNVEGIGGFIGFFVAQFVGDLFWVFIIDAFFVNRYRVGSLQRKLDNAVKAVNVHNKAYCCQCGQLLGVYGSDRKFCKQCGSGQFFTSLDAWNGDEAEKKIRAAVEIK